MGGITQFSSPCTLGNRNAPRHEQPHTRQQQDGKAAVHAPQHHVDNHHWDKQLTNENKVTWYEYLLQEAVLFHGRAAIVAAVLMQDIEEK